MRQRKILNVSIKIGEQTSTIRSILQIICKAHLEKNILQAHLSKTTRMLSIYKGGQIFSPLSIPGTLLDCGDLVKTETFPEVLILC